ncbi:MAG: ADP-forming succinate--CoA ligase subunit beta [Deltaproteobacteria bacterium]|nr:ADP-forming succinate--CoA ligase subunit beta [Deltaproteobacteria bacterium]
MNVHEYQAKALLREHGIPVPNGVPVFDLNDARRAVDALPGPIWVVKAQIHAGGRGKAGGVKIARSRAEVEELAKKMLGMTLVTKQTGPEGKVVGRLYVEEGVDIQRELYLAFLVDRVTSGVTLIASAEGGVEIEEVAEKNPDAIIRVHVNPAVGLQAFQVRDVAKRLGGSATFARHLTDFLLKMYRAFVAMDCSMLEVNPLVVDGQERPMALDAKINFDGNALFRHPNIAALRDLSEEAPSEVAASKFDLSYVKLDGDIGCLVNGAGLAMATMDILKYAGGQPSNFLDVGGSATEERVTEAFKILVADEVKVIFVNIFGGIMKCDTIANGVVAAARTLGLKVPIVVRMEGTNVELGKRILREQGAAAGLHIVPAETMADGADKAVVLARQAQGVG